MQPRIHGFTLIEMMVTVAIAGILAAIAVPSYSYYVMRGKIPEATTGLNAIRMYMEQHYQDSRMYKQVDCDAAAKIQNAAHGNFTFACTQTLHRQFTATATGTAGKSMADFSYQIDETGAQSTLELPDGWTGKGSSCWVTKKGGEC